MSGRAGCGSGWGLACRRRRPSWSGRGAHPEAIYPRIFRLRVGPGDAGSGRPANWATLGRLLGATCRGPLPVPPRARNSCPAQRCSAPRLFPGPVARCTGLPRLSDPRRAPRNSVHYLQLLRQRLGYTSRLSHLPTTQPGPTQRTRTQIQPGPRANPQSTSAQATPRCVQSGLRQRKKP